MALLFCKYLQYPSRCRGLYATQSNLNILGGFPNGVFTITTPCLWNCNGRDERFAMRYRELCSDENSGRTGDRYPTNVREGLNLANRRDRPRRPLRMVFQLRIAWADSCKTIYRWIREEIKQPMVKSGSRNLDVRRQFRGSRFSRMRPFFLSSAHSRHVGKYQH